MLLAGLAFAPVVFIISYIYLRDKYDREPLRYMIISFLLGGLLIVPALFFEIRFSRLFNVPGDSWLSTLFQCMIGIALIEEGCKYLALRFYLYSKKDFDEPYDGIVYAVTVSMGFAAVENLFYIYADSGGMQTAFLRMFTAVPGHAMFGVLMGFFVGLAKFSGSKTKAFVLRMLGLVAAIIPHGLYDFFLFRVGNVQWFVILALLVLLIGIFLALRAIRIHQADSPFIQEENGE